MIRSNQRLKSRLGCIRWCVRAMIRSNQRLKSRLGCIGSCVRAMIRLNQRLKSRLGCIRLCVRAMIRSNQRLKLPFVASPLSMQHYEERTKTGWLGIRIMYPIGTTCLSMDCSFSELPL
jgi:hypothetical protein